MALSWSGDVALSAYGKASGMLLNVVLKFCEDGTSEGETYFNNVAWYSCLGWTVFPFSSVAFFMSKTAMSWAMAIQTAEKAM